MKGRKISSRLNKYFVGFLDEFIFDNFSESALIRLKGEEYLKDVPIPMQNQDLAAMVQGEGITPMKLAENMVCVMGCDTEFQYNDAYIAFIKNLLGDKLEHIVFGAGDKIAKMGQLIQACIYFRAMLLMDKDNTKAMFAYAMALKELYNNQDDESVIGNLKAEAIECLEKVTLLEPNNMEAFYFLGYSYLNMGLYRKAQITLKTYLNNPTSDEQEKEVKEMLISLEKPCEIEDGINNVLSGRYESGLKILEKYASGEYEKNWTIHYHMGIAYIAIGELEKAIEAFKRVLQVNATHLETMRMLAEAYRMTGDMEKEDKYRKKIELIEKQLKEDSLEETP